MSDTRKSYLRGELIGQKFLKGIIPDTWVETVYEADTHYCCEVRGVNNDKIYDEMLPKLQSEFGSNFMSRLAVEGQGSHFVVYLKKS